MSKLKGKVAARARKNKIDAEKRKFEAYKKSFENNILKFEESKLFIPSVEVDKDTCDIDKINKICKTISRTIIFSKSGVGLAAPQIGENIRIIGLRKDLNSSEVTIMINPKIISHSNDSKYNIEGCLSFPGINAYVKRYTVVTVKYFDENWKEKEVTYKNELSAIVVQHEIDHLDGECVVYKWWKSPEEMYNKYLEDIKNQ
ncbi:MAG: peptide deformylase [Clostridia bacterium]|jgi:peptide deformylase